MILALQAPHLVAETAESSQWLELCSARNRGVYLYVANES